jgi:hypothetical protein
VASLDATPSTRLKGKRRQPATPVISTQTQRPHILTHSHTRWAERRRATTGAAHPRVGRCSAKQCGAERGSGSSSSPHRGRLSSTAVCESLCVSDEASHANDEVTDLEHFEIFAFTQLISLTFALLCACFPEDSSRHMCSAPSYCLVKKSLVCER